MRFDAGTKTRIIADMTTSIDPAGSTVQLQVDNTWYAATWQGTAVHIPASGNTREKWTQTAQTTGYFAGPDVAVPGAAVVLALGRHLTQTRVTSGTDELVEPSTPIDVK